MNLVQIFKSNPLLSVALSMMIWQCSPVVKKEVAAKKDSPTVVTVTTEDEELIIPEPSTVIKKQRNKTNTHVENLVTAPKEIEGNVSIQTDDLKASEVRSRPMKSEEVQRSSSSSLAKRKGPTLGYLSSPMAQGAMNCRPYVAPNPPEENSESYSPITENGFHRVADQPLSTFSIDVDNASYANIRRFLTQGQLPPQDAVRIEECINYFHYTYADSEGEHPFSITADIGTTPWNSQSKLVLIGLQAKRIEAKNLPASNLVFLIDVSGSMSEANKLPLLKKSFRLLSEQLRPQDRVSMVVYAGAAGLVLPSTSGSNKQAIYAALDNLQAGGSTAGGEGLRLAYEVAQQHFLREGNNRVILATDGDFNVGESSDDAMMRLIEEKRKTGVYLSVLGFGMGNYKDSKMEVLADKGNGNYAYIDNLLEARKVLVEQMGGTLHVLAKDVKLQVEFNPAQVASYRLIGYENRMLKSEDFNDDTKDAGEMGAGHSVTALYEIIPVGNSSPMPNIDPLKYGRNENPKSQPEMDHDLSANHYSEELLTVKFRYKKPTEEKSRLLTRMLKNSSRPIEQASENLRFAASVAGFGMLLRHSQYQGQLTFDQVASLAEGARSQDPEGYRAEFLRLVQLAGTLDRTGNQTARQE